MAIVGPRPESLALEDCFTEDHCDIFDYKPGIFGPSQVQFRSEADLFPRGCDPVTYYRNVIFPLKAEIDLSYYRQRTFVGDIIWIIRGILAVLGTRSVQRDGKLDTRITRHDDPRRGKSTA
jgi:lipopolysaccharide/colanic/teichoic acid biosynthesis glycosyltransferase